MCDPLTPPSTAPRAYTHNSAEQEPRPQASCWFAAVFAGPTNTPPLDDEAVAPERSLATKPVEHCTPPKSRRDITLGDLPPPARADFVLSFCNKFQELPDFSVLYPAASTRLAADHVGRRPYSPQQSTELLSVVVAPRTQQQHNLN